MSVGEEVAEQSLWQNRRRGREQRIVRVYRVRNGDVLIQTVEAWRGEYHVKARSRLSETTVARLLKEFEEIPPW